MSLGKQLARLFDFEVFDPEADTEGGYVEVGGVTNFSPSPETNMADVTDFDSEGWIEQFVASRGLSFDLEGHHIEDDEDGSLDPGQERLGELAMEVGPDSLEDFKLISPGGKEIEMEVSIDGVPPGMSTGGGNDDPAEWSVTLNISGKPEIV